MSCRAKNMDCCKWQRGGSWVFSNEKGIVKLKLKSGKVFEVPANKLSKEDNEFISSLAKPEGVNNGKKVVDKVR